MNLLSYKITYLISVQQRQYLNWHIQITQSLQLYNNQMYRQIVKNNFLYSGEDSSDDNSMICTETLDELTNKQSQIQQQHKCTFCGHSLSENCDSNRSKLCNANKFPAQIADKKRRKRRDYKQRKQNKIKQQRQQAAKILQFIIKDIYALKTNFDSKKEQIDQCLEIQKDQQRFSQFINYIIRQQVEVIRKDVKAYLTNINFDKIDYSLVPKLFEKFSVIKQASPQIQKIINFFISKTQDGQNGQHMQKKLDQMTFKFILSDQDSKEKLGMFFQTVRSMEQNNLERQKAMIDNMIEMLRQVELDQEQSQSDDYSTSHSSQDYQEQQKIVNQVTQAKKGKKIRKMLKMYEYESDFQTVLNRAKEFCILDSRTECNVYEQWVWGIQKQLLLLKKERK